MMRPDRPLPMALLTACLSASLCLAATAAQPPATVTFAETSAATGDQSQVTAIGLRAAAAPADAAQVIVLVDTSATQTGIHRERSLEALSGILESARPDDRFTVAAVDVASVQLCEGFHPAGSDTLRDAVRKLDARTPLGSTDIVAGLEQAVAQFNGDGPRTIIYIGNGPGLGGVDPDEFARVVDMLRSSHVAVSSLGIGPNVNWQCLASMVANSGGMASIPHEDDDVKQAATKLGAQAVASVVWPVGMALESQSPDGGLRMLPTRLPPLRADRDSIILIEGDLRDAKLEVSLGKTASPVDVSLPIPATTPKPENAYLAELARNARGSDGLFLPVVGREGLAYARNVIRGEATKLAALAVQAGSTGVSGSTVRVLAEASLRRDPTNKEAAAIREASLRQPAGAAVLPRPLPAGGNDDELLEVDRQRQVRGQVLERDAAVRTRAARELLTTNPDQAREDLKALQQELRDSQDLDPAPRERLLAQVEMRIREAIVRAREKTERDLARERREAAGRARTKLTSDLQRREDKILQLTEKYNALVDEGIRIGYAQAENYPAVISGEAVIGVEAPTTAFVEAARLIGDEMARLAPHLPASPEVPMTARMVASTAPLVAQMMHYDAANWRIRRDQQRGFMDVFRMTDAAAIPFADEPPIIYPSPEKWQDITKLRKKYKSVDLAKPGSQEQAIYQALETPVSRWDFNESPLRDVQRAVADEFRIPVAIDTKALEDAGMDLDLPVTQSVSGISLKAALRRLLSTVDLAYIVKDEQLLITTKEAADENLVVKVYPVADLVLPVDPGSGLNPFQSGGGLGGANSINSGQNQGGGQGGAAGGMGGGGGGLGGFCWVAREVYGVHDPRWLLFRAWLTTDAPEWLFDLYGHHGEAFAEWLRPRPTAKRVVRLAMDIVLTGRHGPHFGGAFQVTGARARLADRSLSAVVPVAATIDPESGPSPKTPKGNRKGLPADVLGAKDIRVALAAYLPPVATKIAAPSADASSRAEAEARSLADRLACLRQSAADLGEAKDFRRAADLIAAAISCGYAEPWMYESLAIALEASGAPRAEVERALLSAADFASSPSELMQLAHYMARFGSENQAVRICRRVVRADPTNREAYALAVTLANQSHDVDTLRWACPGVLSHDWPASQAAVATRAGWISEATIKQLRSEGKIEAANKFKAAVDAALVRDLVIDLSWTGDADIDMVVLEPSGSICSVSSDRSIAGGILLADGEAGGDGTTHRERYVVSAAFPGEYRVLIRRAWGKVAADTVTADTTIHRGTSNEKSMRGQIRLGADDNVLAVILPEGRRTEPLLDAQVAQAVAAQRSVGRSVLAQQLATITDPEAYASMGASRGAGSPPLPPIPGLPFNRRGAVGYQPVVTTLPEGVNLYARAVISADRRYVRITCVPLFSGVGQVTTFNYSTGAGGVSGGSTGGFTGAGGVPAGGGGAGGAAGGAGGAAGGAGGAAGGADGAGGGAAGGAGGGAGRPCWVAREVYGEDNPRWLLFRDWLTTDAPTWLLDAYLMRGEEFAIWIHDRPAMKAVLRVAMDRAIADRLPVVGP